MEQLIPYHQQEDRSFYFNIVLDFLEIDCPEAITPEQRLVEVIPVLRQINDPHRFELTSFPIATWEEISFANQE